MISPKYRKTWAEVQKNARQATANRELALKKEELFLKKQDEASERAKGKIVKVENKKLTRELNEILDGVSDEEREEVFNAIRRAQKEKKNGKSKTIKMDKEVNIEVDLSKLSPETVKKAMSVKLPKPEESKIIIDEKKPTFINFNEKGEPVERKTEELKYNKEKLLIDPSKREDIIGYGGFIYFRSPHTGKVERIKAPPNLLTLEAADEMRKKRIVRWHKKNNIKKRYKKE